MMKEFMFLTEVLKLIKAQQYTEAYVMLNSEHKYHEFTSLIAEGLYCTVADAIEDRLNDLSSDLI